MLLGLLVQKGQENNVTQGSGEVLKELTTRMQGQEGPEGAATPPVIQDSKCESQPHYYEGQGVYYTPQLGKDGQNPADSGKNGCAEE